MPSWRGAEFKHRGNFTFLPYLILPSGLTQRDYEFKVNALYILRFNRTEYFQVTMFYEVRYSFQCYSDRCKKSSFV